MEEAPQRLNVPPQRLLPHLASTGENPFPMEVCMQHDTTHNPLSLIVNTVGVNCLLITQTQERIDFE